MLQNELRVGVGQWIRQKLLWRELTVGGMKSRLLCLTSENSWGYDTFSRLERNKSGCAYFPFCNKGSLENVFKVAISENINKEKKPVSCFTHMLHLCGKFNNDSAPPDDNISDIHLNIMCMCWVHPGERTSLLMAASYCIHGDLEQQQDSTILYSATVIWNTWEVWCTRADLKRVGGLAIVKNTKHEAF